MNDDEIMTALRGVKDSLTDVYMNQTADSIAVRAGRRRLRRGLSGAGAGALALGVGLGVVVSGGNGVTPVSSDKSVHVNLAAWSVNSTPGGIVDVTVRELAHPALLRQALARAGVPADVTFGTFCQPRSGGGLPQINQVLGYRVDRRSVLMTIRPAAMPAGTELLIGIARSGPGTVIAVGLVKEGVPLSCRSFVDTRPSSSG
jgi:hypothetical protein